MVSKFVSSYDVLEINTFYLFSSFCPELLVKHIFQAGLKG